MEPTDGSDFPQLSPDTLYRSISTRKTGPGPPTITTTEESQTDGDDINPASFTDPLLSLDPYILNNIPPLPGGTPALAPLPGGEESFDPGLPSYGFDLGVSGLFGGAEGFPFTEGDDTSQYQDDIAATPTPTTTATTGGAGGGGGSGETPSIPPEYAASTIPTLAGTTQFPATGYYNNNNINNNNISINNTLNTAHDPEAVQRTILDAAEEAARFPSDMIPINYTTRVETDITVPLCIPEEPPNDGLDLPIQIQTNEKGEWFTSDQRLSRRQMELNGVRMRRREEFKRRRRQMMERRDVFMAFAERLQMYFVQEVKNDCRNSGFDESRNPWFGIDFDERLKDLSYIGEGMDKRPGEAPLEDEDEGEDEQEQEQEQEPEQEPEQEAEGPEAMPEFDGIEFLNRELFEGGFGGDGEMGDTSGNLEMSEIIDEDAGEDANDDGDESEFTPESSGGASAGGARMNSGDLMQATLKERVIKRDRRNIMRTIDPTAFDVSKLDLNSPDYVKAWGYQTVMRQIYNARQLRPYVRYFLYRELDRVQSISLRFTGLGGLADRIESLEWDIRDYMKKGALETAYNIRTVVRDYRAGFIKLPTDGGCFLYHRGRLLGYFTPDRLGPFLQKFMPETTGPIWKEDGNQPKSLPDHYGRTFAHMFPVSQARPGWCHIHGVPVDSQHSHTHT
ncbi:hypothetical protein TWF730_006931 [Orbilia blumenaviensis]|uniref:Uncharacterized protein n=1 Tax=Orbilia blumenaviensis TaxID=1796055 RepID=A0AAV9VIA5_9PEZI